MFISQQQIFKITIMETEYKFNYDEIKRIFESVPQTKKSKTISYKTRFQPRTKSSTIINNDTHQTDRLPSTILVKVESLHVYQLTPIEQFSLQTRQGFYVIPNVRK
jgi:hypothetical protein